MKAVVVKYQSLLLNVVSVCAVCAMCFFGVQCKYYLRANILDNVFKLKNQNAIHYAQ
jgi:hypothetical protein